MSNSNPTNTTLGFTITGQVETMKAQPNGQYIDGVTVSFITDTGVAGSIWVPPAQYNKDSVQGLILDRVAVINAIHSLGS